MSLMSHTCHCSDKIFILVVLYVLAEALHIDGICVSQLSQLL